MPMGDAKPPGGEGKGEDGGVERGEGVRRKGGGSRATFRNLEQLGASVLLAPAPERKRGTHSHLAGGDVMVSECRAFWLLAIM
jgi:hypothetical protein